MNESKKTVDMLHGPMFKKIIFFALPLALSSILQLLFNAADTIVVGRFAGSQALAAVGSNGALINLIVNAFMGLSIGANVIVARYRGQGDDKKINKAVHTSITISIICGIILAFIGFFVAPKLLVLMSTPEDVINLSSLYLKIYFLGIMGLMLYNMGSAILRAIGDSTRPLYFLIFSSVVNTILDLVFVIVFKLGVAGVALATITAQALSAILVLYLLVKSKEAYRLILKDIKLHKSLFTKMLQIGLPAGLQQSITAFSNIFVQGYVNVFGSSVMAGWSSYVKIDQFVLLPVQSIALASTTFVGQNLGAKQIDRAKKGVSTSLRLSVGVTIILSILLNVVGVNLLGVFSHEADVIAAGKIFLRIFSPFYFVICFNQIYAGAMRGAGDSNAPMVIMLFSFVVFRQISLYIGTKFFPSVHFVAFSYPMGWMLCSVLLTIYYYSNRWMRKIDRVVGGDD